MQTWQQGDVVLGTQLPFLHFADLRAPCTPEAEALAREAGDEPIAIVPLLEEGFAVLTQTCDLVRAWRDRPYVEICPIIRVPDDQIALVQGGYRPRYAALPALRDSSLAVDLDRTMTVEKGLLAALTARRQRGVETEKQGRMLADALARKRVRPALPDLFSIALRKLQDRIKRQHGKASSEGQFLAALREIRVRGIPNWAAPEIEVEFLFIFDTATSIPPKADDLIAALLHRVESNDLVIDVTGRAVGLDSLSAATYLDSDRLDLDHLSQSV